jgi:hypothetical protein
MEVNYIALDGFKGLFEALFIIIVAVVLIPVIISVEASANFTGALATIFGFLPLLLAIGIAYKIGERAIGGK